MTEVFNILSSFNLFSTTFPCGSAGKESACNAEDLGSIPGLGRSPGEGKGYPLQHSGLENSTDRIVLGVAKSRTRLSDFHFTSLKIQSCQGSSLVVEWLRFQHTMQGKQVQSLERELRSHMPQSN